MDGHAQAAAFGGDIAEQEILQGLVLGLRGAGLAGEAPIDALGVGAVHFVEGQGAQIGGLEFFGHGAAFPLPLQGRGHYPRQVLGKRRRRCVHSRVFQVALPQLVFQRKETLTVGVLPRQQRIIERKNQCVGVRNPAKTRGLDALAHGNAVGEHHLDAHPVEHPRRVVGALFALDTRLAAGPAIERLGRGGDGRRLRAQIHRVARGSMLSTGRASNPRSGGSPASVTRTGWAWLSMALIC